MTTTSQRILLAGVPALGVILACLSCTGSGEHFPVEQRPWFEGAWTRPAFPGADPFHTDLTIDHGLVTMDSVDVTGRLVSRVSGHVAGPDVLRMDDGRVLRVAGLPQGDLRLVDESRRVALDFQRLVLGGGPPGYPPPAVDPSPHSGCPPWLVGSWFTRAETRQGPVDLSLTVDPSGQVFQTSTNPRSGEAISLQGHVTPGGEAIQYSNGVALGIGQRGGNLQTIDPRDQRLLEWTRQGGGPPPPSPAPLPGPISEAWSVDNLPSLPACSGLLEFYADGRVAFTTTNRQSGSRDLWTGFLRDKEITFQNGLSMSVTRDANTLKSHDDRNGPLRWRRL